MNARKSYIIVFQKVPILYDGGHVLCVVVLSVPPPPQLHANKTRFGCMDSPFSLAAQHRQYTHARAKMQSLQ